MTDDCPFDGEVPTGAPRRRPTPKLKDESVLDRVVGTACESLSFGDFAKLKSGRDSYSGMKIAQLQDAVSMMDHSSIVETFPQNESAQASCLRWMMRGLDCQKAIRKVKTDLEISQRATGKWKK
jgi:hypothetical protein